MNIYRRGAARKGRKPLVSAKSSVSFYSIIYGPEAEAGEILHDADTLPRIKLISVPPDRRRSAQDPQLTGGEDER